MSKGSNNSVPLAGLSVPSVLPGLITSLPQLIEQTKEAELLKSYRKIFKGGDPNLDAFKILILEVHIRLEEFVNVTLGIKFIREKISEEDFDFFLDELLSKITFDEKLSLVRKLKLISKSCAKKAGEINTLRNRLVHSTGKKVQYKGEGVKAKQQVVKQVIDEFMEITNDIEKKVKEQGIHLLEESKKRVSKK